VAIRITDLDPTLVRQAFGEVYTVPVAPVFV